jgi:hypothetical protein
MKISILTFSKETNYGANLQCYALCKTLQDMGHEVSIIDAELPQPPKSWYSHLLRLPEKFWFVRFRRKYLNIFTRTYKTVDDLRANCPDSDLYIVGSDQVWNPRITCRFNPLVYFFSFLPEGARRISYAASFGHTKWQNPELTDEVKILLGKFEAISVREDTAVDICRDVFGAEAVRVADPTLLLSSYDELCGEYNQRRETNELLYFPFVRDNEEQAILADFAREHGMKAVAMMSFHRYPGFVRRTFVSLRCWLNSIRYARIVVSHSFHCMVFCILFHRRFVAIPVKGKETRQRNLLKQLGLEDHICEEKTQLRETLEKVLNKDIDYQKVENEIEKLRKQAKDFLCEHAK